MIRHRVKLIIAAVATIAAAVAVLGNKDTPAQKEPVAAAPNSDDPLRSEVAELRRELRSQSARVTALAARPGKVAASKDERASSDSETSAPEAAPPETTPAESAALQAELLEHHMASEGEDADWSRAAETQIRDKLEGRVIEGLRGAGVRCAASLCRIDAEFDSVDARDRGLRELSGSVPWDHDGFYRADPSEERKMSFFVTRKDRALPIYENALAAHR